MFYKFSSFFGRFNKILLSKRFLGLSSHFFKSDIKLKGRSKSSQEWLLRQMRDPYIEKAKIANYRCRSAFKLLEIDQRYELLKPGQLILDCGAAPGSWTQVAISKTNANGKDPNKVRGTLIAVDIVPLYPLEGAIMLGNVDLTKEESLARISDSLAGRKIDVLLSDAAPNATGVRDIDHETIIHLAYSIIRFGLRFCREDANLLIKIWEGRLTSNLINDINKFYNKVKRVKPPSSRTDSSELFILAQGFKGLRNP